MSTQEATQHTFTQALQHLQAGRLPEAEALLRQVIANEPTHTGAMHQLGVLARAVGRHDLAMAWMQKVVAAQPNDAVALANLGEACRAAGRLDEAAACYRQVLQLRPDYAVAYINLANVFATLGRLDDAILHYRRALELRPDCVEAHVHYADVLGLQKRWDEAAACYRRALELRPDFAEAYVNLGTALICQGALEEATMAFRAAIRLKSDLALAYYNLGFSLSEMARFDEAADALRRAAELWPTSAEVWTNLGTVYKDQGLLDEAVRAFRHAQNLDSGNSIIASNLIYTLHFQRNLDHLALDAQRRWNLSLSSKSTPSPCSYPNSLDPARRLRLGYVSPDFRNHVVGRNLRPLFRNHNRDRFEIICYSGVGRADKLTEEYKQQCHLWRDVSSLGDADFVQLVRADQVDVLIDLTQHMAGNRLPVFAQKPAPVQMSFAGYPAGTGLDAIAFRISDPYLEGTVSGCEEQGRERLCLIDSFWCYDAPDADVAVNTLPLRDSGRVTFGSLNNFCKIDEPMLRLWARVLREVKNSRLVLLSCPGSHVERMRKIVESEGIAPARVEFVEPCQLQGYLEYYHQLDIVLDPFPYNGHTTSLDALWMGVPVVSLAGKAAVSRAGLSQLSNLGLPELVGFSDDDYVGIATQLARDEMYLAELRSTLRSRMKASIIMDQARFALGIETAFRTAWREWCKAAG